MIGVDVDLAALGEYTRDVRRAARLGREPTAEGGASGAGVAVDADRVRWRRLAVTHAATRLADGRHAEAAFGGLQDTAPRAALLALHARVAGIDPGGWEHPALVQVWLRWADYVVPRADVGVFTLGAGPRDPRYRRALDRLVDAVVAAMPDGRRDSRVVMEALPWLPNPLLIRATAVTGRVHIRWDARTTEVVAAERPAIDADEARRDLARRFLHWLGPASAPHFARWAGVPRPDAQHTWEALAPDMVPVGFEGRRRWLLADDVDGLTAAEPPHGVRLLPAGDPCLFMDDDLPPAPAAHEPDEARGITTRLLNGLAGRIALDGRVVGAWGRVRADVTLDPWPSLPADRRDDVEAEARSLAGPIASPIRVRWLPSRK
jgi:hypothetical protein